MDWKRQRDDYGRDTMTAKGDYCPRCERTHTLTVTKTQGKYWRQVGPHTTSYATAQEAMQ